MRSFGIKDYNELSDFLQTRYIHDGFFQYAAYDQITKEFTVHIENDVWNDSLDMVFVDVCDFISVSDYKWSDDETINCLVLLNDSKAWPEYIDSRNHKDKLCFVWEMISGNQIIISCAKLRI